MRLSSAPTGCVRKASSVVHNTASKLAPWYDCALLQSALWSAHASVTCWHSSPLFQIPFPSPLPLFRSKLWVKWVHLIYTAAPPQSPSHSHLSGHSPKEPCAHTREMREILFRVCWTCSLVLVFGIAVADLIEGKQNNIQGSVCDLLPECVSARQLL